MTAGRVAALVTWRTRLLVAALVVPCALFLVFERQARRLDALASHGEAVDAWVTAISRDQLTTFYAYRVDGQEHTWNVARTAAPFEIGQSFRATYLPETPSFSRPSVDGTLAACEAAQSRSFAWKACIGVALFLLLCAGLTHRDLHRLRAGAPSELNDPEAYRRRLRRTGLALLPLALLIGGFHFQDAQRRGESVMPGIVALILGIGLAGSALYLGGRDGPQKGRERSAKIMRWLVPIVVGIGLIRLIAFFWMR